jgi:hypothetical protein
LVRKHSDPFEGFLGSLFFAYKQTKLSVSKGYAANFSTSRNLDLQ